MALSDAAIRAAKPIDKLRKLSDGAGLQLHVFPNGSKLWRVAYRFDGKQKTLALGAYPEISLARARERTQEARRAIAEGHDPSETRRLDRLSGALCKAQTFEAIAAELTAKRIREGIAEATRIKTDWLIGLALADLGRRPIAEISAAEILAVLRKPEAKGHLETARRLRSVIGQVFRYAVATARVANDPTSALKGAIATPKVKHRAAILDPVQFGAMLRAINGFAGQPTTRAALQLLALLFVRPGELRQARWCEFNLNAAEWIIPAARTKMRREHRLPLPQQALTILRALYPITCHGQGDYVFPSIRSTARAMSENTLNAALRRLGYDKNEATAHGFRATASTLLNESGHFSIDAIERALAHQDQDAVRRAYARGAHWEERVRMANWWADQLDAWREADIRSHRETG
ncbi:MAG: tyrosine-type recombinase/integrase [Hyphomicrobiaceae bacterium]|nr:tyrosine-type recombinase/integrase [Hyphomicrobiaceae bacterium]